MQAACVLCNDVLSRCSSVSHRIVDEASVSQHDAKLLGARNRRQRQLADRKGSSGSLGFEKVQNFGSGGVVGFLVQSGATGSGSAGSSVGLTAGAPAAGCAGTMPGISTDVAVGGQPGGFDQRSADGAEPSFLEGRTNVRDVASVTVGPEA